MEKKILSQRQLSCNICKRVKYDLSVISDNVINYADEKLTEKDTDNNVENKLPEITEIVSPSLDFFNINSQLPCRSLHDQSLNNENIEFDNTIQNRESSIADFNSPLCTSESHTLDLSKLKRLIIRHSLSHNAVRDLLNLLSPLANNQLPKDPRTFLGTPRSTEVIQLNNGQYNHVGLKRGLNISLHPLISHKDLILSTCSNNNLKISLDVNIDGLPLFKSSTLDCWPILGRIVNFNNCKPFVIGIFCGRGKPDPLNIFLRQFVAEVVELNENGFHIDDKKFQFSIRCFICDAPARSYLKCCKPHNSSHGCERCTQEGVYINHRMVFSDVNAGARTDISFLQKTDEDHHSGESPLLSAGIGMVSQFPLDPMHLLYLGVMRRLLLHWVCTGKPPVKLRSVSINKISHNLVSLTGFMPCEFIRRPRTLKELKRWKATEFRMFLLYTGPVVLKNVLCEVAFKNFLLLHCASRILCSEKHVSNSSSFAHTLLVNFVQHCLKLYGPEMVVYNVHNLIHVADDVGRYGVLDNYSAFPFESYLGQLKKLVRSPNNVLQQLCRRLQEIEGQNFNEHDKSNIPFALGGAHNGGPLLKDFPKDFNVNQYKKVKYLNYKITVSEPDNCCLLSNGTVIIVENIILSNEDVQLVVRKFNDSTDLYNYPCKSTNFDICVVSSLLDNLMLINIQEVIVKCVLFPVNDGSSYACFPLLHN